MECFRPDASGFPQLYERMTLGGDTKVAGVQTWTMNGKPVEVVWFSYQTIREEAFQGSRNTEFNWDIRTRAP